MKAALFIILAVMLSSCIGTISKIKSCKLKASGENFSINLVFNNRYDSSTNLLSVYSIQSQIHEFDSLCRFYDIVPEIKYSDDYSEVSISCDLHSRITLNGLSNIYAKKLEGFRLGIKLTSFLPIAVSKNDGTTTIFLSIAPQWIEPGTSQVIIECPEENKSIYPVFSAGGMNYNRISENTYKFTFGNQLVDTQRISLIYSNKPLQNMTRIMSFDEIMAEQKKAEEKKEKKSDPIWLKENFWFLIFGFLGAVVSVLQLYRWTVKRDKS